MQGFMPISIHPSLREKRKGGPGGELIMNNNVLHSFYIYFSYSILFFCLGLILIKVSRVRDFDEAAYFTWIYEGDKSFSHILTTILIAGFLLCVSFPICPNFLKSLVWYMSVSFLYSSYPLSSYEHSYSYSFGF